MPDMKRNKRVRASSAQQADVSLVSAIELDLDEDCLYCAACGASAEFITFERIYWKAKVGRLRYHVFCRWCGAVVERARAVGERKVRLTLVKHPNDEAVLRLLRPGEFT